MKTRPTRGFMKSDEDAEYDASFTIDLSEIRSMIATPGDPRNGVTSDTLAESGQISADIVYGGSCTAEK